MSGRKYKFKQTANEAHNERQETRSQSLGEKKKKLSRKGHVGLPFLKKNHLALEQFLPISM